MEYVSKKIRVTWSIIEVNFAIIFQRTTQNSNATCNLIDEYVE